MKLATFTHDGLTRVGRVEGHEIVDLLSAGLPSKMTTLLEGGLSSAASVEGVRIPLVDVHLEAPIPSPPKFFAIGLNYADHIEETGMTRPDFPMFFNKQTTCVTGPRDPIHKPRATDALDYEGELGFVIGRRCRHVPRERASEVIAGYVIVNDVSVRDWQFKASTMILGKGWDTHGPFGPFLTTSDEIGDPHSLDLRTWVNGELRQNSSTRHLIFDCFELIETISTMCTLEPGDLISTGTPSGVGHGFNPKRFLQNGDVVRIEIEGLGYLENRVIDEPSDTARI